ncbi:MAG: Asp-tRNA(Asn)/Glu-tRNA(Gln) amidotransferase GatCAB subunit B, partial [Armatimonadota bacterium]
VKTELKNLSSFNSVRQGVLFETRRQIAEIEAGQTVRQETRGWNEARGASYPMRAKEEENDYRYFPDPDLPPLEFSDEFIEGLRAALPELPIAKERRYRETLGLSPYDANFLVSDLAAGAYFEEALPLAGSQNGPETAKTLVNWMMSDLSKLLNADGRGFASSPFPPAYLVELVELVAAGTINGKTAKEVLAACYPTGASPRKEVARSGATQITDEAAIRAVIEEVIAAHPDVMAKFRSGQTSVQGFLLGQTMKRTAGRAAPPLVAQLLKARLEAAD